MPSTDLKKILSEMDKVAAEHVSSAVFCPECGDEHRWIKHGFYWRYLFKSRERIKVQRYRCRNPECSRQTFSILAYPFLRIARLPLCILILLLENYNRGDTIAHLSRTIGKSKGVVRRALAMAARLQAWIRSEGPIASWGPDPHSAPRKSWTDFLHDFSHFFYPARY